MGLNISIFKSLKTLYLSKESYIYIRQCVFYINLLIITYISQLYISKSETGLEF